MLLQKLFCCLIIVGLSNKICGQQVLSLKDNREIFIDDYLIQQMQDVKITLHEPHDEGVVFYFDKPWEGNFSGYVTIIRDNNSFRAYYRGIREAGKDGRASEVTCLAQSKDGIHWEKPDLQLFEIDGSVNNNIVLAHAPPVNHNFSPFIDTKPEIDLNQKYKALGGTEKSGLMAYTSADGIHWNKLQDAPVFTKGKFDSQNVAFWSESENRYVCYFRIWTREGYSGFRSVGRTTSKDFINWTEPVAMTFGPNPMEHLYTQQTSPYFRAPHIYIAIGGRLIPGKQILTEEQALKFNVNPKYYKDCSDAYIMSSRGADGYDRTFMESFIRPGIGLNNWVSRSNYPALNVVQTSPVEMSIYVNQDYAQPTAHLRRYSLRLDGFSSIWASYRGGKLLTRPFTFDGDQLEINYATSAAGEIRIEIQDADGQPIENFSMEDSQRIIGNEISRIVTWNGNSDLHNLIGKTIQLCVSMKDANLYSIRFK
jgi:hypothetical protein